MHRADHNNDDNHGGFDAVVADLGDDDGDDDDHENVDEEDAAAAAAADDDDDDGNVDGAVADDVGVLSLVGHHFGHYDIPGHSVVLCVVRSLYVPSHP